MVPAVLPVSEARFCKSRVAGEAVDPVAMQKRVEMFRSITSAQMLQIGVPEGIAWKVRQTTLSENISRTV